MTTETTLKDWSKYPVTEITTSDCLEIRKHCVSLRKALTRLLMAKNRDNCPTYPEWIDEGTAVECIFSLECLLNPDRIPFSHQQHDGMRLNLEDDIFDLFNDLWLALHWLRYLIDDLIVSNQFQGIEGAFSYTELLPRLRENSKLRFSTKNVAVHGGVCRE